MHRRATLNLLTPILLGAGLICSTETRAASETWDQTGGTHDWNAGGNWVSGSFPNAAGDEANLTNNISSTQVIELEQSITVGLLNIGDSDSSDTFRVIKGAGSGSMTFDNDGSAVEINNLRGANQIGGQAGGEVYPMTLVGDVELYADTGTSLSFYSTGVVGTISGGDDIVKKGGGTVSLGRFGNMSFTGDVTVEEGELADGRFPSGTNLTVHASASYKQTDSALQFDSVRGAGLVRTASSGTMVIGTGSPDTSVQRLVLTTDGELHPGDDTPSSVGFLTFNTTGGGVAMRMETGSNVFLDIENLASNDKVRVVRKQSLIEGGDVHVNFLDGFAPQQGDSWVIWDAVTIDGGFIEDGTPLTPLFDSISSNRNGFFLASLTGPPNTSNGNPTTITLTYLPEPATVVVLGLGALALVRRR